MSDIVERLRELCDDWDGSEIPGPAEPRIVPHCRLLREAAATIERLTRERDHFLSNWKDARRYLTIETGHAEDAEARADSLAAELAKAREALTEAKSLIDEGRWIIAQGVIRAALPVTPEPSAREEP